jgi:hypothetical protein
MELFLSEYSLYTSSIMMAAFNGELFVVSIPELVKVGLLSPIYKNKGDKNDSKNYRGIVVLPIICKLLEHIARTNFRTILTEKQTPLQRGFTTNSSPLNAAIIIEEVFTPCWQSNESDTCCFHLMQVLVS